MNNVTTDNDDGFSARVSAIANRIAFGAEPQADSNPLEVVAARMLLADEAKQQHENDYITADQPKAF